MATPKNPSGFLHFPLLLLLFIVSLNARVSSAGNYISLNRPLSGSQTIISKNGKFELGFFQPGNKTIPTFYIGIWYTKIPQLTVVWVANREIPVTDPTTSQLRISDDGNLVLLDQSRKHVWSTNSSSLTSNTTSSIAVILNSGNLVLRDGSNPSLLLWQSFDHPTDTYLPGSKFGVNKVTGVYQQITSWKNSEDPAPGIFSHSLDPAGSNQLITMWNRSKLYRQSGMWNGHFFSQFPTMMMLGMVVENLSFVYISNATMNYFTYSVENSTNMRVVLSFFGQIKMMLWMEEKQQWQEFWADPELCKVYALCGPFSTCSQMSTPFCSGMKGFRVVSPKDWSLNDFTKGCMRSTPLHCCSNNSSDKDRDKFFVMTNVITLPHNPTHSVETQGVEECERICLSNCSCTAYSSSSSDPCSLWYGGLLNLQHSSDGSSGGDNLYLRLAVSEFPSSKSKKPVVKYRVVLISVGGLLACLTAVLMLIWIGRMRHQTKVAVEGALVSFQYSDLKHMTRNFSERLGGGAFGSVFKGTLPDSSAIAVKKLENLVYHGEKQFRAEVSTIGIIQHVNLVRLRGFCSEGTKKLLVYEYMPRGSLDRNLFQRDSMVLGWNMRYQIALGVARGLSYLHEKCKDCIIHCDIKPENILLDDSCIPKVADFGMAKLVSRDFSRVLTTLRGTIGYLAPEWIYGTTITAKADVYSYGMMLFEIISGRRNMEKQGRGVFFPLLAASKVVEGDVLGLLDQRLEGNTNLQELERACKVACWCVQDNEINRPSMGQVVKSLEGVIEVSSPPIPRSFQVLEDNSESMIVD